ncbi:hypothetical protein CJD36_020745 [Flavipsychrobacter stenotrophus]|uniref:Uncharacterized protein n=1 Tax=Flavipsychrobacter stenotrophus TaxID=2077091 RepID=A0A2S7SRI0_9BACT|nr:hypothetical protein [Flavipsychrobacter stenotrophus]PQJ09217.1 hypothetical protein CJD36_020745 [Flavipsychrobacter stenotrophus]
MRKETEKEEIKKKIEIITPLTHTKHGITLSKEIAEMLNLINQPQTLDLFEKSGKRATMSFRHGDEWLNNQKFIYIRKDLLEKYLAINKLKVFWFSNVEKMIFMVWGRKINNVTGESVRYFQEVVETKDIALDH